MATWKNVNSDIQANGQDAVRRKYLRELSELTGRPVMLYAVEMFDENKIRAAQGKVNIDFDDKVGFQEVTRSIAGPNIDVILHSPGGRPEAAETLVTMLRTRFNNVRFIVPNIAKSAATMMVMSGEQVVLGQDAELGPTDPQFTIFSERGAKRSPAHSILEQFEKAKKELANNTKSLPAWLPILEQYGPSLLIECQDALDLSSTLVKGWLKQYMFANEPEQAATEKSEKISGYLVSREHLSHGRAVTLKSLKDLGVNIIRANEISLEFSNKIQEIDYAVLQTFAATPAYKIFDNSSGEGFYRLVQMIQMPIQMAPAASQPTPNGPAPVQPRPRDNP
jgi:hypothetical protein